MALIELGETDPPGVTADPLPHVASPYVWFRRAAARSRTLPAEAVARLLDDDDSGVRTTMARTAPDRVDLATAERIDRDFRPEKRTAWRPADDFTFPAPTLRRFATDPDPRMRCLAPRDPDLPAGLADPDLPAGLADPDLPAGLADPDLPAGLADPDLPAGLAARLAAYPDPSVRRAIAAHPQLPTSALIALLADESAGVAQQAAASPTSPETEMERLLSAAGL